MEEARTRESMEFDRRLKKPVQVDGEVAAAMEIACSFNEASQNDGLKKLQVCKGLLLGLIIITSRFPASIITTTNCEITETYLIFPLF